MDSLAIQIEWRGLPRPLPVAVPAYRPSGAGRRRRQTGTRHHTAQPSSIHTMLMGSNP